MPASGDLRSEALFFSLPPPGISTDPPRQIDPTPNGNDLGHYMKSYRKDILSKFAIIVLMPEIIFVSKWIRAKMPHKTYCECEKFTFWAKNGRNLKLRHRKAQKMILSGRYGDPYGKEGDRCRIWESWHVWCYLPSMCTKAVRIY